MGELRADWTTAAVRRRVQGGRRQPLARAIGLHKHKNPRVLDACAGLGVDGFVLACLGAEVTMTERCAVVFALLNDARRRGAETRSVLSTGNALTMECMDAINWLQRCPQHNLPDVIYLDPMYAGRGKTALPAKGMQVLQALLSDQPQHAMRLMQTALGFSRQRVVVKRPVRSPPLAPKPDFSYSGKQVRYDVYLTQGAAPRARAKARETTFGRFQ